MFVIDDEPAVLRAYARLLHEHKVETENDPRAALARLASTDFDLILCDLTMPALTGAELYRQLVRQRPKLAARFAFVTGNAVLDADVEDLLRLGVPLFKKPLVGPDLDVLIARVSHPSFKGFS